MHIIPKITKNVKLRIFKSIGIIEFIFLILWAGTIIGITALFSTNWIILLAVTIVTTLITLPLVIQLTPRKKDGNCY